MSLLEKFVFVESAFIVISRGDICNNIFLKSKKEKSERDFVELPARRLVGSCSTEAEGKKLSMQDNGQKY